MIVKLNKLSTERLLRAQAVLLDGPGSQHQLHRWLVLWPYQYLMTLPQLPHFWRITEPAPEFWYGTCQALRNYLLLLFSKTLKNINVEIFTYFSFHSHIFSSLGFLLHIVCLNNEIFKVETWKRKNITFSFYITFLGHIPVPLFI